MPGERLVGRINHHVDTLELQLRLLAPGIVGRVRRPQAVTAQEADDQLGLGAAGHNRHGYAVHENQPNVNA